MQRQNIKQLGLSEDQGDLVRQNKQKEQAFFDNLAQEQPYNVFTDLANQKIIETLVSLLQLPQHAQIADLGCGSGVFSSLLQERGYQCYGVDLSQKLLVQAKKTSPHMVFLQADAECLPFENNSLDAIIFSCLLHHFPDPTRCLQEAFRVLKPQGRIVGFDPNRLNPIMYLYRDKSSPFYSANGVTENERPVVPSQLRALFKQTGFTARSVYIDGLSYRYIASDQVKVFLPIYNFIDRYFFKPFWMRPLRAFVFTAGYKL